MKGIRNSNRLPFQYFQIAFHSLESEELDGAGDIVHRDEIGTHRIIADWLFIVDLQRFAQQHHRVRNAPKAVHDVGDLDKDNVAVFYRCIFISFKQFT